jgi:drug/metabolite transporter (DMT)-like permease
LAALLARCLRRCEGVTALLVTGGLVLLVPKLSLSNPVVLALAFLGEVPGPWTLAGGALIVAAAVTATRRSSLVTVGSPRRIR